MSSEAVNKKYEQIIESLASETGVKPPEVEVIVSQLGLKSALQHRETQQNKPDLSGISLASLRIAAGQLRE